MGKHSEHFCTYNDGENSCECYDAGFEAGSKFIKKVVNKMNVFEKADIRYVDDTLIVFYKNHNNTSFKEVFSIKEVTFNGVSMNSLKVKNDKE